jgi:hypothetical protein
MTNTINIQTLTNTVSINISNNLIDFYTKTLNEYLPLNGINNGIDKVSETIQNELYNLLYYPIKMELFKNDYLEIKHANDFDEIFMFIKNGTYFDYNFNVDSLIGLINNQLNKLFIRIKKNTMKKRVLSEIQDNNDCFIMDYNNITKIKDVDDIVSTIKDNAYTQLLSFVFYYDSKAINYNFDSLHKIVMDLKHLANNKKYTKFIKEIVQFELKEIHNSK